MNEGQQKNLEALFDKMEGFVTTKTVVGDPVNIGNVIIVPLVDVSFGLTGGYGNSQKEEKSGGGGGGSAIGAKITPTAVLVIIDGAAQMINVKQQDSVNKLIDMVPGIMSKLGGLFGGRDAKNAGEAGPEVGANPPDAEPAAYINAE